MSRKSFTILELTVVIIILGILVTFGIPVYLNIVEDSKAKICETNLKALSTALDLYAMEHDVLPAVLSQIPEKYIREAYRRVLEGRDAWKIELAYFIAGYRENKTACAQSTYSPSNESFLKMLAKNNSGILVCPADKRTGNGGGLSYGINRALQGLTYAQYKALAGSTVLIGDCDSSTFSNIGELSMSRHKHYRYAWPGYPYAENYYLAVTKDKALTSNLTSLLLGG